MTTSNSKFDECLKKTKDVLVATCVENHIPVSSALQILEQLKGELVAGNNNRDLDSASAWINARTKGIDDIVTVKNGNTFVERHNAVRKIVEILLESGASFDEANLALRLAREKIGCFEMKKRPSGN